MNPQMTQISQKLWIGRRLIEAKPRGLSATRGVRGMDSATGVRSFFRRISVRCTWDEFVLRISR
jgi:hypothetical protein